jgi:L-2-hydroxyglutarate oxidase LhgO
MDKAIDVLIAGAGIVGLATAYQLIRMKPNWRVVVLEKEAHPAMHQTSHNSGVVHSGVYYKPGSLKAKNCIAGRKELLSFCDDQGIPYKKIHKLIVATREDEIARLKELQARGVANGVQGIRLLSESEVREVEPNVYAKEALFLPECQIIEYKQVALALCSWIRAHQGEIIFNERVVNVKADGKTCSTSTQNQTYRSRIFLSCTGLYSDRLARNSMNVKQRIIPFRGEYYELSQEKSGVVQGLIYPVPDPRFPFLGVHLTPMMNGRVEAGPNAILALSREGYRKSDFSWKDTREFLSYSGFWKMAWNYWKAGAYEIARSMSKELFLRDLQRLVPSIQEKDLHPGGSGVRAQVVTREGKLLDDFSIVQEQNTVYVLNAPSPAATASFSIGRTLAEMILNVETE